MNRFSVAQTGLSAVGGLDLPPGLGLDSVPAIKKLQSQLSHNLHVALVHIRLAATSPALARAWVHEDELEGSYEKGEPRPDAVIFDGRKPVLAVEFGGDYSAQKLFEQRRGCARRKLPWELW